MGNGLKQQNNGDVIQRALKYFCAKYIFFYSVLTRYPVVKRSLVSERSGVSLAWLGLAFNAGRVLPAVEAAVFGSTPCHSRSPRAAAASVILAAHRCK